ncbi:uncharacterized protein LOC121730828 [Aricia agestis]|uniref:uncharacterized protein LOC121730828 n=1 Tax=Aricia agestis TaxID=91739 RepID=UPI001C209036|nr:uncharacterized protein LOC121730828 [Aricia agestis]
MHHLRIASNLLIISSIAISVLSIKVPVDNPPEQAEATDILPIKVEDEGPKTPVYYLPNDGTSDSFLIPPHQLEEIEVAAPLETPATYLLPPAPGKHIDYYYRGEEPEQTDWYPIPVNKNPEAQAPTDKSEDRSRNGKILKGELPSRSLLPPTANAQNDYIILTPSVELELPNENIDKPMILQEIPNKVFHKKVPHIHPKIVPAPYFMPKQKYYPTKLYPKKVVKEFRPIPIPISQYAEGVDTVPMARPVKPFRPAVAVEGQYEGLQPPQDQQVYSYETPQPPQDKQVYSYEKAENQRKLQSEIDGSEEQKIMANEDYEDPPREQEASETNFGHPGRNAYPAPLKQAPPVAPAKYASANGERTEFRMHGMKGPHSYQFGYDTGKGKNRQFRYEERDNDGNVKGHYGYVDKFGKLRVVNYDADQNGFRAEAPIEKESR